MGKRRLARRLLHQKLITLIDWLEQERLATGRAVKTDCDCGCGVLHAARYRKSIHIYDYVAPGQHGKGSTRLFDLFFVDIRHCNRAMRRWKLPQDSMRDPTRKGRSSSEGSSRQGWLC